MEAISPSTRPPTRSPHESSDRTANTEGNEAPQVGSGCDSLQKTLLTHDHGQAVVVCDVLHEAPQ